MAVRTSFAFVWATVWRSIGCEESAKMTTTANTRRTRRDMLKETVALAGLGLVTLPEWVLPALAQGDTIVPFLDFPDRVITNPAVDRRIIDIRAINGPRTPKEEVFTTQHYGH